MLYIYLLLGLLLLLVLAISFLRSITGTRIPPNAQLIVDAWNATSAEKEVASAPITRMEAVVLASFHSR